MKAGMGAFVLCRPGLKMDRKGSQASTLLYLDGFDAVNFLMKTQAYG
jgi:hypothetical protein